jgi:hypothetical protein
VRISAVLLLAVLCASTDLAAAGQWTVDAHGNCVNQWTPASLARGPLAMTNALTFPVRQLVGGGQAGADDSASSTGAKVLLVPALALLGLGTGTMECVIVMGQGIADFVTAGTLDLVSDESADVSLAPMTPRFLTAPASAPKTDPCGRPRS